MSVASSSYIVPREQSTTALRYSHLYEDLRANGKLSIPDLKVMILGVGCLTFNGKLSSPQANEMSLLVCGKGQELHLVDKDGRLLEELSKDRFAYDSTPLYNFHLGMQPRPGICRKRVEGIVNFFRSQFTKQMAGGLADAKIRFFQWNPQSDLEGSPRAIENTYDVIVATCSALYPDYIADDQVWPTYVKVISLLKNHGVLYVDSESFAPLKNSECRDFLQTKTRSRLICRRIVPIVEPIKGCHYSNKYLVDLPRAGDGVTGNGAQIIRGLSSSHSVYAIKRCAYRNAATSGSSGAIV